MINTCDEYNQTTTKHMGYYSFCGLFSLNVICYIVIGIINI